MVRDVHHVPGRIRFKIPGLRNGSSSLGTLAKALSAHDGVHRIEVREASDSLIVHYDPNRTRSDLLAATVKHRLSGDLGRAGELGRLGDPGLTNNPRHPPHAVSSRGTAAPKRSRLNGQTFVPGSVRQMGVVFGQAAFKVALEPAVRGGLNSFFRVTLGRI